MSRHAHCGGEIVERSVSEQCDECKAVGVPGGLPRCQHEVTIRLASLGIEVCADCGAEIPLK